MSACLWICLFCLSVCLSWYTPRFVLCLAVFPLASFLLFLCLCLIYFHCSMSVCLCISVGFVCPFVWAATPFILCFVWLFFFLWASCLSISFVLLFHVCVFVNICLFCLSVCLCCHTTHFDYLLSLDIGDMIFLSIKRNWLRRYMSTRIWQEKWDGARWIAPSGHLRKAYYETFCVITLRRRKRELTWLNSDYNGSVKREKVECVVPNAF